MCLADFSSEKSMPAMHAVSRTACLLRLGAPVFIANPHFVAAELIVSSNASPSIGTIEMIERSWVVGKGTVENGLQRRLSSCSIDYIHFE